MQFISCEWWTSHDHQFNYSSWSITLIDLTLWLTHVSQLHDKTENKTLPREISWWRWFFNTCWKHFTVTHGHGFKLELEQLQQQNSPLTARGEETDGWELKRVQSNEREIIHKWIYRDGGKMSQTDREAGCFVSAGEKQIWALNSGWISMLRNTTDTDHLIQTWSTILQLRFVWSRWSNDLKWENLFQSHDNKKMFFTPSEVKVLKQEERVSSESRRSTDEHETKELSEYLYPTDLF